MFASQTIREKERRGRKQGRGCDAFKGQKLLDAWSGIKVRRSARGVTTNERGDFHAKKMH